MTKNTANYIGLSTVTNGFNGYNQGMWNIISQFNQRVNNLWNKQSFSGTYQQEALGFDGYRYLIFTAPGTFTLTSISPTTVEYLVVGAGGPGGSFFQSGPDGVTNTGRNGGGGGGAGGLRTGTFVATAQTPYSVTVGGGGGNPSTIVGIVTANGGGTGGPWDANGSSGGSGGGAGESPVAKTGGTGNLPISHSPPQGNPGGNGGVYSSQAGGGGGAGAAGNPGVPGSPSPGKGGDGLEVFPSLPPSFGTPGPTPGRWFAGGGGGISYFKSPGLGGAGGGGRGDSGALPGPNYNGVDNTGGGGGGLPAVPNGRGLGGSGIVIIRY